jgi:hypothetical protein
VPTFQAYIEMKEKLCFSCGKVHYYHTIITNILFKYLFPIVDLKM